MSDTNIDFHDYNQYGAKPSDIIKTSLLNYFNNIVLDNQLIFENNNIQDDGAYKVNLTNWGDWFLQYTPEGSVGLSNPTLTPKKPSNETYSRMYYLDNVEPDYQVVFRIDPSDGYTDFVRIKYNDNVIHGIMRFKYSNSVLYDLLFSFGKSGNVITINDCFIEYRGRVNSTLPETYLLKYGVKSYDRVEPTWYAHKDTVEKTFVFLEGKTYKINDGFEKVIVYVTKPTNIGKFNVGAPISKNLNYKSNFIIFNNYKKTYNNIDNGTPYVTLEVNDNIYKNQFYYYTFKEGYNEKYGLSLTNNFDKLSTTVKNVEDFTFNNLYKDILYKITSLDYYKTFVPKDSLPMVKGYIYGNVDLNACGVDPNTTVIKVIRAYDNYYIGEYDVKNNQYRVDNLDYNTRYDIILYDKSRTIEQVVRSYVRPTLYEERTKIQKATIGLDIDYTNYVKFLRWSIDGEYDYIKIYKSPTNFNANNLPTDSIKLHNINYYYEIYDSNVYYYMVEFNLDGEAFYSNVVQK